MNWFFCFSFIPFFHRARPAIFTDHAGLRQKVHSHSRRGFCLIGNVMIFAYFSCLDRFTPVYTDTALQRAHSSRSVTRRIDLRGEKWNLIHTMRASVCCCQKSVRMLSNTADTADPIIPKPLMRRKKTLFVLALISQMAYVCVYFPLSSLVFKISGFCVKHN